MTAVGCSNSTTKMNSCSQTSSYGIIALCIHKYVGDVALGNYWLLVAVL